MQSCGEAMVLGFFKLWWPDPRGFGVDPVLDPWGRCRARRRNTRRFNQHIRWHGAALCNDSGAQQHMARAVAV